jgi:hypothetical protein
MTDMISAPLPASSDTLADHRTYREPWLASRRPGRPAYADVYQLFPPAWGRCAFATSYVPTEVDSAGSMRYETPGVKVWEGTSTRSSSRRPAASS